MQKLTTYKQQPKEIRMSKMSRKKTVCILFIVALFISTGLFTSQAWAGPKQAPQRSEVIMLGDRVVDIAYNLGVVPAAMSVRCALWPLCKELDNASQVLGCPNCVRKKKARPVLDTVQKTGIQRIIVEKHPEFCMYMDVAPEDILPMLQKQEVKIEYVDFADGLESAVRQTARLLECQEQAEEVIKKYSKEMAQARKNLPDARSSTPVVIINGVHQPETGRIMLRVEAPGGYADKYLLHPLGCVNKGGVFQGNGEPHKGHFMVKKNRNGPILTPLMEADPEIIVTTGSAFAVQKSISRATDKNPDLQKVPAIKNNRIYSLPRYIDASVMEYPQVLKKWTQAVLE
jgi:ABC-type Fe3+-hydroxamate transport system substrate-binding protein